jgi:cystathionine beta-lyase/cystathionine gamma-synthase
MSDQEKNLKNKSSHKENQRDGLSPKLARPESSYSLRTRLIHGRDRSEHWEYRHHVIPPITASSSFRLDSTQRGAKGFAEYDKVGRDTVNEAPIYLYNRMDEPTVGMLEEYLATAEVGKFALCFSSGMAAVSSTLMAVLQNQQQIVAHKTIYGCTYSLMTRWLPRSGVTTQFINMTNLKELEASIHSNTRVVYLESPANPNLELIDLLGVSEIVKKFNQQRDEKNRIYIIVDNTFATPYCQRPLQLGADIVIHSLTKNLCGFGTDMGGAVITNGQLDSELRMARKDFGGVLSPRSAWNILVYGIGTLHVRVKQQIESCMRVSEFLESHSKVARVIYPGLKSFPQRELAQRQMRSPEGQFAPGTVIYFELKGHGDTTEMARTFIDKIADESYVLTLAVSLGQIRTLIECPGLMTHAAVPEEEQKKAGFSAAGIRRSDGS